MLTVLSNFWILFTSHHILIFLPPLLLTFFLISPTSSRPYPHVLFLSLSLPKNHTPPPDLSLCQHFCLSPSPSPSLSSFHHLTLSSSLSLVLPPPHPFIVTLCKPLTLSDTPLPLPVLSPLFSLSPSLSLLSVRYGPYSIHLTLSPSRPLSRSTYYTLHFGLTISPPHPLPCSHSPLPSRHLVLQS